MLLLQLEPFQGATIHSAKITIDDSVRIAAEPATRRATACSCLAEARNPWPAIGSTLLAPYTAASAIPRLSDHVEIHKAKLSTVLVNGPRLKCGQRRPIAIRAVPLCTAVR